MRLIHISDLHFGMHRQELIEPFFADLSGLNPDVVIISGDVTQRAKPEQFIQLKQFLTRFSVPCLVVPGNHDIPLHDVWARFTHPFKQYKHFVSANLDVHFKNSQMHILGVNSATPYKIKDGALTNKEMSRIKEYFAHDSGLFNVVFFHHNLNYFSGMHHPLNNAEEFIHYLKDSPIHLVCTGHMHYANLKVIPKNNAGSRCAILHAGSLLCQRSNDGKNSFYVIDFCGFKATIDYRVYNNQSFSSHQCDVVEFDSSNK